MPYRCVHCSSTYADDSREVIAGCTCGSKFFFYLKPEKLALLSQQAPREEEPHFTAEEKTQMEEDVREVAGLEHQPEIPVFLDFESVKMVKPGKYLIDLAKLFSQDKPKVYHLEDGKYIVELTRTRAII